MGNRLYLAGLVVASVTALVLLTGAGTQGPPVYVANEAPSGSCSGDRVWITKSNPANTWCCISGTWTTCNSGVAGAQLTATKWCVANDAGTQIVCNKTANSLAQATLACATGYFPAWNGTAWACESNAPTATQFAGEPGTCLTDQCMTGIDTFGEPTACVTPVLASNVLRGTLDIHDFSQTAGSIASVGTTTVSGALTTAECTATARFALASTMIFTCKVTSANTVQVTMLCPSVGAACSQSGDAGFFEQVKVLVFNP